MPISQLAHFTKDLIVDAVWRLQARGNHRDSRAALVVAPSNAGSLGDAAMLAGCINQLRRVGHTRVDVLSVLPADTQPASVQADQLICVPNLLLSGARGAMVRLASTVKRYSVVYVIGADIIDGVYSPRRAMARIRLMELASAVGLRTVLVGSSISETPDSGCMRALGALPAGVTLNLRERVSENRLAPFLARAAFIHADAAFLLADEPIGAPPHGVARWLDAMAAAGKRVVAVNTRGKIAQAKPQLLEALAHLVKRLINEHNLAVLTVPHDSRSPSDIEALRSLPVPAQPALFRYESPMDPLAIRATMARVPLSITGRMHLAILGLTVGTVPLSMTYQGKFEGLYELFKLPVEKLTFDADAMLLNPDMVVERVLEALRDLHQYSKLIARHLPDALASARGNIRACP